MLRRKSSPECNFTIKSYQNDNWINSQKRSSLIYNNENSLMISEVPPFLRSYSSYSSSSSSNYSIYTPPLSISSSHHSYFNKLPAAPEYSSLKTKIINNKKRKGLRASIMSQNVFDTDDSDTSRRSSSDIELATEIGQGLLSEIRRMQTILQEKQERLVLLENEKIEHKQTIDELSKQLLQCKNDMEDQINQIKTMYKDREEAYQTEIKQLKLLLQTKEEEQEKDNKRQSKDITSLSISESAKSENKSPIESSGSSQLELKDSNSSTDDLNTSTSSLLYSKEWQRQNLLAHPMISINEDDFDQTDLPAIMHTMIGEWLYKYIRFKVHHGISDHRHRRFFWLHPYTKVLYWCQQEPGLIEGEWKAKSATIESFHVDGSDKPAIMIKTSTRNLKIECITKDSHDKWVQSLYCLLSKQDMSSLKSSSSTRKKKWRFSMLSSNSLDDVSKLSHSIRRRS